MMTEDRGPLTGIYHPSPVLRPRSIFRGVFTNLWHAASNENAFRRSAVARRRSIF